MRIIGHIEHPTLKITVFKMDNRLSVKFESGLYEMTYKFRAGDGLETFQEVQALIDENFLAGVESGFQTMHQQAMATLARNREHPERDEFEEIV